jgi:endoglucanase
LSKKNIFSKIGKAAVAACFSAVTLMGSLSVSSLTPVKAADTNHDDWLHVDDNCNIVDANGNPVWLTGCNWFGYNVGSQVFDGVWSQNMHDMLKQIADHGFNFLRVPMSSQILLQWKNGDPDPATPKVNTYSNPELTLEGKEGGTCMYSFDIWNKAVEWCKELGIKIMIDIHSVETNAAGHQVPVWYTSNYSTEDWLESLSWLADYYKDDDTILAIDLKNEPHGKAGETMAKWDDSKDENNWKYAAERGANAVLEKNPNLLVMVEGVEVYPKFEDGADWSSVDIDYSRYPYSYYHHTWWGANFRGAKDYPVNLGKYQKQLVYSPHDYGPLVYAQTWFEGDFTYDSLMKDCWHDNWFYLYEEKQAPLLIGEWGGFIDSTHDKDGKNLKWMTYLRELITKYHIHHTFWCFNENSGDTGGLVYDNFGKWDEDKYNFVKEALWQDKNGKFISLDHTVKLGDNGISLSDYYGGGSSKDTTSGNVAKGDMNLDGKLNVVDLSMMKASLLKGETPDNGDYNGDGTFSVSDVVSLARYIIKR